VAPEPEPGPEPTAPIDPEAVLERPFTRVRRGYDPLEVQQALMALAAELRAGQERERELAFHLQEVEVALAEVRAKDPERLSALLGEETARVIGAANTAADDIRAKAVADGERIRRQAERVADRILEGARREGRELVVEAQAVRERMLRDTARRRKLLRQQLEQLHAGRDRLLAAYAVVRERLDETTRVLDVAVPEARRAAEEAGRQAGTEIDTEMAAVLAAARADDERRMTGAMAEGAGVAEGAETERAAQPIPGAASVSPEGVASAAGSTGPTPLAPDPIEGRHSSAVRVIRTTAEHPVVRVAPAPSEAEPPAPRAGTDEASEAHERGETPDVQVHDGRAPEGVPAHEPADEPSADEPSGEAPSAEAPSGRAAVPPAVEDHVPDVAPVRPPSAGPSRVAGMFARILEEAVPADVEVDVDVGAVGAVGAVPDVTGGPGADTPDPGADGRVLLGRALARRLKRELSDEQNELLDGIRRAGVVPDAESFLPEPEDHVGRYANAALGVLAGAGDRATAAELAADVAAELVGPLRDRYAAARAVAADPEELAEAVRAIVRDWKAHRVDALAAGAASRGLERSGSPMTVPERGPLG
jgi:cell division septum initiation protein DivIVA